MEKNMNKNKMSFVIIFVLFFIEFASAEKTVTDYYNVGCKALKKGKIEKAENNFLEAINISIRKVKNAFIINKSNFSTATFEYDVKQASEAEAKNDWRVYYYKGLLEANMIFDYKTNSYVEVEINNASKELSISTLKKSISLYDNYQSRIALSFLGIEGEKNKAIQLAKNIGSNEAAGNIEYSIGIFYERKNDFEEALVHYKNSLEYLWKSETNEKIKNLNKKIELASELKEQGITYQEYERKQSRIATRRSWKNLENFLLGNYYASHIPPEKGDKISVPQSRISLADVDVVDGHYSYLFTAYGDSVISKYAYIVTKTPLRTYYLNLVREPLVIQCEGTASYKHGVSVVDTYVFSLVE